MSKIEAVNNFETGTWEINISNNLSNSINLLIGFKDKNSKIVFNDLSFGYQIKYQDEIVKTKTYPFGETVYVSMSKSQQFLESDIFEIDSHKEYQLRLWCKNNDILLEEVIIISLT